MRKRLAVFLAAAVILTAGCQSKDYSEYRDAMEQTSRLDRYEEHFRLDIQMDYNLDALDDDEAARIIDDLADFSIEAISKEDRDKGLVESEVHIFYGGVGLDADYFVTEQGSYLTLPFIESYVKIDSSDMGAFDPQEYGLLVSDQSLKKMQEIWLDMVTDDEVFKGEVILVDTPDGKVKTSKYTIEISDVIFKQFLGEIAQVLLIDDVFLENLANQDLPEDFDVMELMAYVDSTSLDEFVQEVYVDVDGYIVKETLTIAGSSTDEFFRGFHMEMESELYGINQDIVFDFPDIDDFEIMTFDELEDTEAWKDFNIEQ